MAARRKIFDPLKVIKCYYRRSQKFGNLDTCILCFDRLKVLRNYYLALEEHLKSEHPSEYEIFYTEVEVMKKTQHSEFDFGDLPEAFVTEVRKHFELVKPLSGKISMKCKRCKRFVHSASNNALLAHLRTRHPKLHAQLAEVPEVLSSFDASTGQRTLAIDDPSSETALAQISKQNLLSSNPSTIQEHFILTNQSNAYMCRHCSIEVNNVTWSSPACVSQMRDHLMTKHEESTRIFFDRSPVLHLSSLYSDIEPLEVYKKHYLVENPPRPPFATCSFSDSVARCQPCDFRIAMATAKPLALVNHLADIHSVDYLDFMREYKAAQFELINFVASTEEEILNYFTPKFCTEDIVMCYLCLMLVPCQYLDSLWDHMYKCHMYVYNLLANLTDVTTGTTQNSIEILPSRLIFKYFSNEDNFWECKKCSMAMPTKINNLSLWEHLVLDHYETFLEFRVDYRNSMKQLLTLYNAPVTDETLNDYYKIIMNRDTFAKCEICYFEFNYNFTLIDLMIHLKVIHNNDSTWYTDTEKENNGFFDIPEVQNPLTTNPIWKYFDNSHDSDVASCKECKNDLQKDIFFVEMRNHLELEHSPQFISFLKDCELEESTIEIKYIEKNQKDKKTRGDTCEERIKMASNNEITFDSCIKKYFIETKENSNIVTCKLCSRSFLKGYAMKRHLLLDHDDKYAASQPEKESLEDII